MSERILLIEDDSEIAALVKDAGTPFGLELTIVSDGKHGLERALSERFAAIVLDIGLPSMNGLDLCRAIREKLPLQPILFLTSQAHETDIVLGLELGADDYITKPFRPRELVTRIRSVIARYRRIAGDAQSADHAAQLAVDSSFVRGDLSIDFARYTLHKAGVAVTLSTQEWIIVENLLARPGLAVSREHLISEIWGEYHPDYEQLLTRSIWRVRSKLETNPDAPANILTVRGMGYRWNA